MKYWTVTFRHTTVVEAETEADARGDCANQVRDNAEAEECEAEEIRGEDYDAYWAEVLANDDRVKKSSVF